MEDSEMPERRTKRARDVALALRYQLESCRENAQMEALVLADEDGLCLAASGSQRDCDEVAAVLPLLSRSKGMFEGTIIAAGRGLRLAVRTFRYGPAELFACAVGGADERRSFELERSIAGMSRILAA